MLTCFNPGRHSLYYHNRIINDQTGGKDDAKQSKLVNRKTKYFDENQRPEQGNWQGKSWHHGGLPVLQKQKDNQ